MKRSPYSLSAGSGIAATSLPSPFRVGARISVYQPPPGAISTTVIPGSSPKKARVSAGCR